MKHHLIIHPLGKIASFLQRSTPIAKNPPISSWVPSIFHRNHAGAPKLSFFDCFSRWFCSKRSPVKPQRGPRTRGSVKEARKALLEYLHCTRGLEFVDAEHMSNSSPLFLSRLLAKVGTERDLYHSITRFLRYHPIDEFELFLESLGLEPGELELLVPNDLTFLNDSKVLLENYRLLRNYGINHGTIGMLYKEGTDIFLCEPRVLDSKLRAFEDFGMGADDVANAISSNVYLLFGDDTGDFITLLEKLRHFDIDRRWLCSLLCRNVRYSWSCMTNMLQFLLDLGINAREIRSLTREHPDFLLDNSGRPVFVMAALLLKCGATRDDFVGLLRQFPPVPFGSFVRNLLQGLDFLVGIGMEPQDIRRILIGHTRVLGSCSLKSHNTAIAQANGRRKWLRETVREDPCKLTNWAKGISFQESRKQKTKFLTSLGFAENSEMLDTAIRSFRGKGDELQKRHDFLVSCGLKPDDVSNLVRMAPNILNLKIDSLRKKTDYLVDVLGYPLETLVAFPYFFMYTLERVKHRFSIYSWLKAEGVANPSLKLSTIIALPDKQFIKHYVSRHPKGLEVWEKLKKEIYTA